MPCWCGDQCMLEVVIRACWRWWSEYAGGSDQCMLEFVIRASWKWWSEHADGGDQGMLVVVIRVCWRLWGGGGGAVPWRGLFTFILPWALSWALSWAPCPRTTHFQCFFFNNMPDAWTHTCTHTHKILGLLAEPKIIWIYHLLDILMLLWCSLFQTFSRGYNIFISMSQTISWVKVFILF